ncbi:MAG: transposase family protein, partial [Anaerolineales bacterium]
MDSSIRRVRQKYGPTGTIYDLGSVDEGLRKLTDVRKAKGKIYSLDVFLMLIVMAKLCGVDSPYAIGDWAKNHRMQLVELLQLKRPNTLKGRRALPSHHTIRRIMGRVVYEEE